MRPDAVDEGLRLARARRWFDAHEAFEDAWRVATGPRRSLLRALVHACVALEHLRRGNAAGVALQLPKAQARMNEAAPDDPLTAVARAWIEAVVSLDPRSTEDRWPVP